VSPLECASIINAVYINFEYQIKAQKIGRLFTPSWGALGEELLFEETTR
jgi:hypothetical protein